VLAQTKDQELVPAQFFRVLTIRRARSTTGQELVPTQSFRALTMRRAKPKHKREDNFKNFN